MDDQQGSEGFRAVAALPSAEAARGAAEELRRSGFGEDRISLAGEGAADRPTEPERRERDRTTGRRARRMTWLWAGIGAVIGAVLGVIAAVAFDTGTTGIVVFGVAGAIVGGLAAALIAGIGSLEDERPSEASVVPENERRSVVGVAAETREDVDRAVEILRRSGATAVEVFDGAGNRVHAA